LVEALIDISLSNHPTKSITLVTFTLIDYPETNEARRAFESKGILYSIPSLISTFSIFPLSIKINDDR